MSAFEPTASFPLPYGAGPPPPPAPAARLSRTAVASFVLALLSPLGICFCYPTVIGSGLALLLAHVAMFRIWRSGGEQWGAVWAGLALLVSYPLFGLGVLWLIIGQLPRSPEIPRSPEQIALSAAERKILGDAKGVAHGNSPRAKELAESFSARLKELRDDFFTDSKTKIKLSGDQFVTFCQLEQGRCVFLVHAPDLRHFTDDAEKSLAELAWAVGKSVAGQELEDGDQLGVGLKGVIFYGAVMTGQIGVGKEPRMTKNSDDLLPFFAPSAAAAAQPEAEGVDVSASPTEPAKEAGTPD